MRKHPRTGCAHGPYPQPAAKGFVMANSSQRCNACTGECNWTPNTPNTPNTNQEVQQ